MPKVYGSLIDTETRCRHYFTEEDIIAIKFKCLQCVNTKTKISLKNFKFS